MIEIAIFTACLVVLGIPVWGLICNERNARHRHDLVEAAFAGCDWQEMREHYCAVTYDQHLAALMLFRDPFKLYDPRLIARLAPSNLEKATS